MPADPDQSVNPSDIQFLSTNIGFLPDLTPYFSIMCVIPNPAALGISNITSMVISKSVGIATFNDIASMDSEQPPNLALSCVGGKVTGKLDPQGRSFIRLDWTYPSKDVASGYLCEVNSFNATGSPISLRTAIDIKVTSAPPDKQRVPNYFYISEVTDGKQYLVSRFTGADITLAEAWCNVTGGHLADIRCSNEYSAVKTFLQTSPSEELQVIFFSPIQVFTSTNTTTGRWVNGHSGEDMTYTEVWGKSAPYNTTNANCAAIFRAKYKAYNIPCDGNGVNFICERTAPTQ